MPINSGAPWNGLPGLFYSLQRISALTRGQNPAPPPDGPAAPITITLGTAEASFTTRPDGVEVLDGFEDGARVMSILTDTADTYDWDSVELRYGASGTLTQRTTVLDNGQQQEDFYDGGVRVAKRFTDLTDSQPWSQVTNFYADGQRVSKLTDYDSGVQREDFFENGLRVRTVQRDFGSGEGGAESWQEVTKHYNSAGALTLREIVYDDGILRSDSYIDGVRRETIKTDASSNLNDWAQVRSSYDASGQISERTTVYDNGVERLEFFVGGKLDTVLQSDFTDAPDVPWRDIISSYGASGDLEFRQSDFDDGTVKTESFINGLRDSVLEDDLADSFEWAQIARSYDAAGSIADQTTTQDNGDVTVMLYAAGTRDVRIEFDGDESDAWVYRETQYDAEGVAGVQTYAQAELLPPDYAAYFVNDVLV